MQVYISVKVWMFVVGIPLLISSCHSSKTQIHFDSAKIDSFKVELINPINGTIVLSESVSGQKNTYNR